MSASTLPPFVAAPSATAAASVTPAASPPPEDAELAGLPFRETHRRVAAARDDLSHRLDAFRTTLRARAAARPELLAKLDAVPAVKPTGYGLLPELGPDPPESSPPPWETRYDYPGLATWIAREVGRIAELETRLQTGIEDLSAVVDGYLTAKTNHDRIDQHVAYHRFWQVEARKSAAFFQAKNKVLADYRLWRAKAGSKVKADKAVAEEARRRVETHLDGFAKVKAIPVEARPGGGRALVLTVATDVEDTAFLDAITAAVERTWNQSKPMTDARLRLEVRWDRRSPASLYPEGPPARGAKIDTAKHRERFGQAAFVLTTGAESTHVLVDTLFLGTASTNPRVLAHELGHFLGFADGYLRAFEGSIDDANGVVFVEVGPFPESLMASPGTGRVTDSEVKALLAGYAAGG
jgi:hypothetical protein